MREVGEVKFGVRKDLSDSSGPSCLSWGEVDSRRNGTPRLNMLRLMLRRGAAVLCNA